MDTWTSTDKWWFSLIIAVLFVVMASAGVAVLTSAGVDAVTGRKTCYEPPNQHYWWILIILGIIIFFAVRLALA